MAHKGNAPTLRKGHSVRGSSLDSRMCVSSTQSVPHSTGFRLALAPHPAVSCISHPLVGRIDRQSESQGHEEVSDSVRKASVGLCIGLLSPNFAFGGKGAFAGGS